MHALICSLKRERFIMLKNLLQQQGYTNVSYASSIQEAQSALSLRHVHTCMIDLPFTLDKQELAFLLQLQQQYPNMVMIVLCGKKSYEQVNERLYPLGMFVMIKPMQQDVLVQLLSFSKAAQAHYHTYEQNQSVLLDKIKTIKLIDRAKCILMEQEYYSEAQAHRFIEKKAMDQRTTRSEVAKQILADYEDL